MSRRSRRAMSDLLADRLQLIVDDKTYEDNVRVTCGDDLATAVRAYWRERRPTREDIMARMPVAACCRSKDGFNDHDCYAPKAAAAICALFDRVWGEG